MIDLSYSKSQMLADIGAAEPERCWRFEGQTRDEMLPSVESTLRQQFATMPPDLLFSDLLLLVKSGLGNAYKRGNGEDPNKTITVEAVTTAEGAVVTISNEGEGFNVDSVVGRFRRNEQYFAYQGKGLLRFAQSRSLVSYSDNGRSLHIRFLCEPEPGRPLTAEDRAAFGEAANPSYMQAFFSEELGRPVVRCRIYRPHQLFGSQRRLLYALRLAAPAAETLLLSGELLTSAGLQTAVLVGKQLDVERIRAETAVSIVPPHTCLPNPPVAFYPFNPQHSFDKRFKQQESLVNETLPQLRQLGAALRHVHGSQITLTQFATVDSQMAMLDELAITMLVTLAAKTPERVPSLETFLAQLRQRASQLHDAHPVPSHGNLSWYSVLHGQKRFYLHGFEQSCYTHPGFDLGGFLADLLRATDADTRFERGERAFLSAYFGEQERPLWANDIPFFVAFGLVVRLERLLKRPFKKWDRKVDDLLAIAQAQLRHPMLAYAPE